MFTDRQGNPVIRATPEAVEHFDTATQSFSIYRGDPLAAAENAIEAAPDFAMAYILKAYLFGLATEPSATSQAQAILSQVKNLALSEREKSHVAALEHLLANNWTKAAIALDGHNWRFPHDLIGLQAGHLMDFYRANARNLRDRIARVLPRWSEDRPGYAVVLGMYAFGLEESGNYALAEEIGREAVAREPLDCWAHHAVAHVMEMQGRARDGIAWMLAREPYWSGDDNFFKVHNWWHKALYHLDLGETDLVLSIYDTRVRGEKSTMAIDLVDASALLWRIHAAGIDVGSRWENVADNWENHADGRLYPFNDWHATMAYLGAGRVNAVDRLIQQYHSAEPSSNETARWATTTGLPLIEGFKAFTQGRYADAVVHLHGARFIANSFGGSHAQRDVIDWTLTEAAIRSGKVQAAKAFADERVALKPHSPLNQRFLERAKIAPPRASLAA